MTQSFAEAETYEDLKELCQETNCLENEKVSEQIFQQYAQRRLPEFVHLKPFYLTWKKFVKAVDHLLHEFPQLRSERERQEYLNELIRDGHFLEVDILISGPEPIVDGIKTDFYREIYEFQRDNPLALLSLFNAHSDAFQGSWRKLFQRLALLIRERESWELYGVPEQEFVNELARRGNIVEVDMISILPGHLHPTVPFGSLGTRTNEMPDYSNFNL